MQKRYTIAFLWNQDESDKVDHLRDHLMVERIKCRAEYTHETEQKEGHSSSSHLQKKKMSETIFEVKVYTPSWFQGIMRTMCPYQYHIHQWAHPPRITTPYSEYRMKQEVDELLKELDMYLDKIPSIN